MLFDLQEKKRNNLKDFLNVAGPMGVSHFLILSKTATAPYLRVARTPQGPTITFKIHEYSLASDIAQSQLRPRCPPDLFKNSPLVWFCLSLNTHKHAYTFSLSPCSVWIYGCSVFWKTQLNYGFYSFLIFLLVYPTLKYSSAFGYMQFISIFRYQELVHCVTCILKFLNFLWQIVLSGFGLGEQHLKLTTIMFQNIFPAIDINTVSTQNLQVKCLNQLDYHSPFLNSLCWMFQVKLSSCQRIVLLNYNKDTKLIDFRHYSIRLQPVGVSRRIRKFVQNHQVPDLRSLQDVSDFVTK